MKHHITNKDVSVHYDKIKLTKEAMIDLDGDAVICPELIRVAGEYRWLLSSFIPTPEPCDATAEVEIESLSFGASTGGRVMSGRSDHQTYGDCQYCFNVVPQL